ncbi:hypothetical protein DFJ73DRAFT_661176, partial [Zopfochytrium polystomum]
TTTHSQRQGRAIAVGCGSRHRRRRRPPPSLRSTAIAIAAGASWRPNPVYPPSPPPPSPPPPRLQLPPPSRPRGSQHTLLRADRGRPLRGPLCPHLRHRPHRQQSSATAISACYREWILPFSFFSLLSYSRNL